MKGHMEILAASPYAKAKRETLNVTPHLRLYVENNLHDFTIKPNTIKKLFRCETNKAKLIYGYIQERRRQIGILEPIVRDGFIYLIENAAFDGWVKCGMTTDLTARLNAYNGYDPVKRFRFIASKEVANRRKAEAWMMNDLKMKSAMQTSEWFHIPREFALEVFERIS